MISMVQADCCRVNAASGRKTLPCRCLMTQHLCDHGPSCVCEAARCKSLLSAYSNR